jgi:hypothetical protein
MKFEYFHCTFVKHKDTYTTNINENFLFLRQPLKPTMTFSNFLAHSIDFC